MFSKTKKYLASPPGFDDIGAVLDGLGEGFAHSEISWAELQTGTIPDGCEVLFINCAGEASSGEFNAIAIRKFVERGGSLYASDWAGGVISSAFPKALTFDQDGQQCEAHCNVVDEGLREVIGEKIQVHFDLVAWWRIRSVSSDTRVYVRWQNGLETLPIVIGFQHGRGHVIYTSFHNEAQISEAEQKLLRFLVLRPILAQAAYLATEATRTRQFAPGKEIIETINRGQRCGPYIYKAQGGEGLLYLLQWEGAGTLQLTILDPFHKTVFQHQESRPPLQYEVASVTPGDWTCNIEAINAQYANLPFVLTVATRAASKSSKPITLLQPAILSRKGTYSKQWGSTHPGLLIILLDQSSSMNDPFGASQLLGGKKKCDAVATVLNNLLYEFIRTNTVGADLKPRVDIAVLAYEGGTSRSALKGVLAGKPFVSLPELNTHPLRVETRNRKELTDDGTVVEIPTHFPIWVEPMVGSATPMSAALRHSRELAETWVKQHPHNYPPVVINITDGASTDGDPREAAQELCEVGTSDGTVLLFNVYLTDKPLPTIEFPHQGGQIPPDPENLGTTLFDMSSEIPELARKNIASATGQVLSQGSRGLILNGDAGAIRSMFIFATVSAARSIDLNR